MLAALLLQTTAAQFAETPFFEHAEALGAAHGLEMADIRLTALSVGDEPDELAEELEAALERDLPRFMGSLSERDAGLARELEETLAGLLEGVSDERTESFAETVQEARELLGTARNLVVPEETLQTPAFRAALMTLLLLAEEGVAERFEEAAEGEEEAYAGGRAALQRVEELWEGLEPLSSETQRFEVNDMLAELGTLFPSPMLPDPALLIDAEAAENPAQRIAGFLEELADASLFPDRELGGLVSLIEDSVERGCDASERGEAAVANQHLAIAGFYYAQYLGGTLSLLAPEIHESLEPLWAPFAGEEDEGDEDEEENESDEDEDEGERDIDCQELMNNLEQARDLLGA